MKKLNIVVIFISFLVTTACFENDVENTEIAILQNDSEKRNYKSDILPNDDDTKHKLHKLYKLYGINLDEIYNAASEIVSQKDSILEALDVENKEFANLQYKRNDNKSGLICLIILSFGLAVLLFLSFRKQRVLKKMISQKDEEILMLKNKLDLVKSLNNNGEKLYYQVLTNKSISTWTTADMVNFIEYYRTLKPDFVETLDNSYKKLSPRYKIILVLEDMGKTIEEIMLIMSFEESSYYSAKSRINGAKK